MVNRQTELFSFTNVYHSYLQCRRNKRNTVNALKFEINAEANCLTLSQQLQNKTYKLSRAVAFIVKKPKLREIIAADFRDRIVHHILVSELEKVYEPAFIYDSYACRKGKGTHAANERLQYFIQKMCSQGIKNPYCLHMDIQSFFVNINKTILYELIEQKLHKVFQTTHYPVLLRNPTIQFVLPRQATPATPSTLEGEWGAHTPRSSSFFNVLASSGDGVVSILSNLLWLTRIFIFQQCKQPCIKKGKPSDFAAVPTHKSVLKSPDSKGLPIGNLSSQFFANIYLNELDQYVKHQLKCQYYMRYVDDFVILSPNPQKLLWAKTCIIQFLQEKLQLTINPRYGKVIPINNGINFLGYITHTNHVLVRRRIIHNLKQKLKWYETKLIKRVNQAQSQYLKITYPLEILEKLTATLASYWGILKHADTYHLKQAIIQRFRFLAYYFCQESLLNNKVKPIYPTPRFFDSVYQQYHYFKNYFKETVLFFQVGQFIQFYSELKLAVKEQLGLIVQRQNKGGVRYGFPAALKGAYLYRLLKAGHQVILIQETGAYFGKAQQRVPVARLVSII